MRKKPRCDGFDGFDDEALADIDEVRHGGMMSSSGVLVMLEQGRCGGE